MKTRILSPALEEIVGAATWYDSQAAGLGGEFWQIVDDTMKAIGQNPHRYPQSEFATSDLDLRYVYIKRFKHIVHFAIESSEVLVVAVTHAARKPGYWINRVGTD